MRELTGQEDSGTLKGQTVEHRPENLLTAVNSEELGSDSEVATLSCSCLICVKSGIPSSTSLNERQSIVLN